MRTSQNTAETINTIGIPEFLVLFNLMPRLEAARDRRVCHETSAFALGMSRD